MKTRIGWEGHYTTIQQNNAVKNLSHSILMRVACIEKHFKLGCIKSDKNFRILSLNANDIPCQVNIYNLLSNMGQTNKQNCGFPPVSLSHMCIMKVRCKDTAINLL